MTDHIATLSSVLDSLLVRAHPVYRELAGADYERGCLAADALAAALHGERERITRLEKALNALRWRNNDGTYEDDCWCDVKSVDMPNWHSPQCEAARAALASSAAGQESEHFIDRGEIDLDNLLWDQDSRQ